MQTSRCVSSDCSTVRVCVLESMILFCIMHKNIPLKHNYVKVQ